MIVKMTTRRTRRLRVDTNYYYYYVAVVAFLYVTSNLVLVVRSARCNGSAKPGPSNESPIDILNSKNTIELNSVQNGKRFLVGTKEEDQLNVIHLYGEPYDWGLAHGLLMKKELNEFFPKVIEYVETQLIAKAANHTLLAKLVEIGIDAALDLSYEVTKRYTPSYVMEEIRGLSKGCGVSENVIRRVMWIGELTRGSCSMFGAWGNATKSRDGKLLQLRALDWDVDGPFRNYPAVVVYHPKNESYGHPWANVGFIGWTASITGMSAAGLSVSEIGVSFPDISFGKETYLEPGVPFGFLIRDLLQYDRSLDDAINRITNSRRTCDLLLGVGDGNANAFRGFQYAPSIANVFDDQNLMPLEEWHPRIDSVVYWGMDWICPNDNQMLSDQLKKYYGNITALNTIRYILPYVQTGDLHIAIYDHANRYMYVANAASENETGELEAYRRTFLRFDLDELFSEPAPAEDA